VDGGCCRCGDQMKIGDRDPYYRNERIRRIRRRGARPAGITSGGEDADASRRLLLD